ncbi:MAG: B12-binding domain-containing radical SAM protein [Nitrospirota bacterium]
MKLKVLLINPWIYDFAAINLWSRPLGILKVAEYLSGFDVELALIDCTDIFNQIKYGASKYPKETTEKPPCIKSVPRKFGRYGISIDDFRDALRKNCPFDAVLVTSIMSYWYPGVRKVIEIARSFSKDAPIMLGGIYATLWSRHASETSGADFIYTGHISDNIKFAFNTFGFRIKKKREGLPYYRLGLYRQHQFAPVLTSTGCPFRCAYCSSRFLYDRFIQRDSPGVVREIQDLYSIGIRDFAFYDDALLVNAESHIKVILKEIIKHAPDARFHCPNGLHARFIDDELAGLMKNSGFRTLRLGLETVDVERQRLTGGKVTSEDLLNAVKKLKNKGFTKNDIGVYLMYGLPGQGLDEIKEGVQFLKSLDVRINLTEFSPMPKTEYWEKLKNKGIVNDEIDPLLTNNSVFAYLFSGYDIDELARLKLEVKEYNLKPPGIRA